MYLYNSCMALTCAACYLIFDHIMTEEKNTLALMLNLSLSPCPVRKTDVILDIWICEVIIGDWLRVMEKLTSRMWVSEAPLNLVRARYSSSESWRILCFQHLEAGIGPLVLEPRQGCLIEDYGSRGVHWEREPCKNLSWYWEAGWGRAEPGDVSWPLLHLPVSL